MRRTAAIALLLLAAFPAAAQAGALTKNGTTVTYTSKSLEQENLVLFLDGAQIQFFNSPGLIHDPIPTGCSRINANSAQCTITGLSDLVFDLRDGDDFWKNLSDIPLTVVVHGSFGNDYLESRDGRDLLFGDDGEDTLDDSGDSGGAGDLLDGGAGNDLLIDGEGSDDLHGGDGIDTVDAFDLDPQTITLDSVSNDGIADEKDNYRGDIENVIGGLGNDHIVGSAARNRIDGREGDDLLEGSDGDDALIGGEGSDELNGGAGFDRVEYPDTPFVDDENQTITIDNQANDGIAGEEDNVHTDIEDVDAGPGNDKVTGSAGPNTLIGGGGDDELIGGGGVDTFFGNAGADTLRARDGLPERVDCGTGADTAIVDTTDEVFSCEDVNASNELVPDVDGDGSNKPADCDDANPAIHPGAVDVPENGIDENCDGVDALVLDRDGDGFNFDLDCVDTDPTINPGAVDTPGDAIDQDCKGGPAPFPSVLSPVTSGFSREKGRKGRTRFRQLRIRHIPAGGVVRVRCIGGKKKGCPFKSRRFRPKNGVVRVKKPLSRRFLKPGAKVQVRITAPSHIGKVVTLTVVGGRDPVSRTQCLPPGTTKPAACR